MDIHVLEYLWLQYQDRYFLLKELKKIPTIIRNYVTKTVSDASIFILHYLGCTIAL